jgi:hypothetical protein
MAADDDDAFSLFSDPEDEQPAGNNRLPVLCTPHPLSSADLDFKYRSDGPMGAFHVQPNPMEFEEDDGSIVRLTYNPATKQTDIENVREAKIQWEVPNDDTR